MLRSNLHLLQTHSKYSPRSFVPQRETLLRTGLCLVLMVLSWLPLQAQDALFRAKENVEYSLELGISSSVHRNPLWLQANRHGLASSMMLQPIATMCGT